MIYKFKDFGPNKRGFKGRRKKFLKDLTEAITNDTELSVDVGGDVLYVLKHGFAPYFRLSVGRGDLEHSPRYIFPPVWRSVVLEMRAKYPDTTGAWPASHDGKAESACFLWETIFTKMDERGEVLYYTKDKDATTQVTGTYFDCVLNNFSELVDRDYFVDLNGPSLYDSIFFKKIQGLWFLKDSLRPIHGEEGPDAFVDNSNAYPLSFYNNDDWHYRYFRSLLDMNYLIGIPVESRIASPDFMKIINDFINDCSNESMETDKFLAALKWAMTEIGTRKSDIRNIDIDMKTNEVTFLPKGKESILASGGSLWDGSGRQSMKTGKMMRKVISQSLPSFVVSDVMIENLAHYITSYYSNIGIEVVVGDDIAKYYLEANYAAGNTGTLSGSCMRQEHRNHRFNIYTKNEHIVSMAIMRHGTSKTKIIGRALLWNIDGQIFMDRIYGVESTITKFKRYAKINGYYSKYKQSYSEPDTWDTPDGKKTRLNLEIRGLFMSPYWRYPYMDTFSNLNPIKGIAKNYPDSDVITSARNADSGIPSEWPARTCDTSGHVRTAYGDEYTIEALKDMGYRCNMTNNYLWDNMDDLKLTEDAGYVHEGGAYSFNGKYYKYGAHNTNPIRSVKLPFDEVAVTLFGDVKPKKDCLRVTIPTGERFLLTKKQTGNPSTMFYIAETFGVEQSEITIDKL